MILGERVRMFDTFAHELISPSHFKYKQRGDESSLHIIIFDELDAICKQRGSKNDGTGVGDSIVNQLLSKVKLFF